MFKKFPSIEQLHTIAREALKYGKAGDHSYVSKIKLHGTNACVRIHPNGTVAAQKRTGDITPERDNFDFAKWVEKNADWFRTVFPPNPKGVTYVHGEWAGIGIQKTDAVSTLPRKFYIFMIEMGSGEFIVDQAPPFLTSNPDVAWIPTFDTYTINFFNQVSMDAFVEKVTQQIEDIGKIDPYIKQTYDIEGVGEGLVFYPKDNDFTMMFKLKTLAHSENRRTDKIVVSYNPETVQEIEDFADKYCTELRYQQALTEMGIRDNFSIKDTGKFIGWVCRDVYKECPSEAEFNGFQWKDLAAVVTRKARQWFLEKVK